MTKNNPFHQAKRELKKCAQETAKRVAKKADEKKAKEKRDQELTRDTKNDATIFRAAISGTRPLKDTQKITPTVTHKTIRVQRHLQEDNFEYALSDFAGEINTSTSDEVLSFRGNGIQQRLFKKLRHGQIPVEARLDLHGLTVEPAREILSHFITDCLSQQYMCIIIVHGKGSRGDLPVLKTMLNHWLKQIPDILAYSSAQPKDGGTGALYVLLKNKQKMNTL